MLTWNDFFIDTKTILIDTSIEENSKFNYDNYFICIPFNDKV